MYLHRLNIKIAMYLALILAVSMLMLNAVTVVAGKNQLIRTELDRAGIISRVVGQRLVTAYDAGRGFDAVVKAHVDDILRASKSAAVIITDSSEKEIYRGGDDPGSRWGIRTDIHSEFYSEIRGIAGKVIKTRTPDLRLTGMTWGVFWKQKRYLIKSAPVYFRGRGIACVTTVISLDGIYMQLRHAQSLLLIYILVNTLLFTFIGLNRFSKIMTRPLQRLLRRAEDFSEEEEIFFPGEKGESEFNQISNALNRMILKIAAGKEELRATVRSLEKANRDLKQAQNDIINAEKLASVGRLSAGIAHEIGNPIAIVIGYLDLIRQPEISETDKADFIDRTEDEISRISGIIRQLLDFSRPASEDVQAVSLHEVISDVAEMIRFQPIMSRIRLEEELSAEKDEVRANPSQLRQIFLNLILNSADAISGSDRREDGRITVWTQNTGLTKDGGKPMVRITVQDNGTGIPEAHRGSVFEPFFTTKPPGKGTGLGLSVCYMIIEAMGGKIRAAGSEGGGTSMIIHLPVHFGNLDNKVG